MSEEESNSSEQYVKRRSSSIVEIKIEVIEDFNFPDFHYFDLILHEQIGKGAFGEAHKVENDGLFYAMKTLFVKKTSDEEEIEKEIEMLEKIKSIPNIPPILIKYYGYCKVLRNRRLEYNLLMEYKENTLAQEIDNRRRQNRSFSIEETEYFAKNLIKGLAFLQENNIAHRDLKPGNIICDYVNGKLEYRLIDFGASKFNLEQTSTQTIVGTYNYMAPELRKAVMENEEEVVINYNKSDLYSFGLILLSMIILDFIPKGKVVSVVKRHLNNFSEETLNSVILKKSIYMSLEEKCDLRVDPKKLRKIIEDEKIVQKYIFEQSFFFIILLIFCFWNLLNY